MHAKFSESDRNKRNGGGSRSPRLNEIRRGIYRVGGGGHARERKNEKPGGRAEKTRHIYVYIGSVSRSACICMSCILEAVLFINVIYGETPSLRRPAHSSPYARESFSHIRTHPRDFFFAPACTHTRTSTDVCPTFLSVGLFFRFFFLSLLPRELMTGIMIVILERGI